MCSFFFQRIASLVHCCFFFFFLFFGPLLLPLLGTSDTSDTAYSEREPETQGAKVNGWKLHLSALAFWPSSMTLLICRHSDTRPEANDFSSNLHFSVTLCGWCVTFFLFFFFFFLLSFHFVFFFFFLQQIRTASRRCMCVRKEASFSPWSTVSVRGREREWGRNSEKSEWK